MNVAILGASEKPDRFANRAQVMLAEYGHDTYPVSLSGQDILGRPGFKTVLDIPDSDVEIHTITVYMRPQHLAPIVDEILPTRPARVIFNPGTESPEIAAKFREAGIHVVEACTLILLETGEFESA